MFHTRSIMVTNRRGKTVLDRTIGELWNLGTRVALVLERWKQGDRILKVTPKGNEILAQKFKGCTGEGSAGKGTCPRGR